MCSLSRSVVHDAAMMDGGRTQRRRAFQNGTAFVGGSCKSFHSRRPTVSLVCVYVSESSKAHFDDVTELRRAMKLGRKTASAADRRALLTRLPPVAPRAPVAHVPEQPRGRFWGHGDHAEERVAHE
jgi:hypothetical protein